MKKQQKEVIAEFLAIGLIIACFVILVGIPKMVTVTYQQQTTTPFWFSFDLDVANSTSIKSIANDVFYYFKYSPEYRNQNMSMSIYGVVSLAITDIKYDYSYKQSQVPIDDIQSFITNHQGAILNFYQVNIEETQNITIINFNYGQIALYLVISISGSFVLIKGYLRRTHALNNPKEIEVKQE